MPALSSNQQFPVNAPSGAFLHIEELFLIIGFKLKPIANTFPLLRIEKCHFQKHPLATIAAQKQIAAMIVRYATISANAFKCFIINSPFQD